MKVAMGARENGLRINDLTTYRTIKENYDIKLLLKSLSDNKLNMQVHGCMKDNFG
jgi:hypothetical protein